MSDLKGFSTNIKKIALNVEKNSEALVRKVALAVDTAVVLATPVDTGRARANWQVELNSPATGTLEQFDKSGQSSIAQCKQAVEAYNSGDAIHITNNLSYIGKLNQGSSAQAPANFVEKAVLVGVSTIERSPSLLSSGSKE